jgi:hypothetical protein
MIDIDSLTIGQARQIAQAFGQSQQVASISSDMIGKYCIVRSRDSGVHAGVVVAHSGDQVRLKDSRRLWYWKALKNHTLTAVSLHGICEGRISPVNPDLIVIGACEISPCSDAARTSIEGFPSHEQ